ncbi:hypothetical protein P5P86_16770 [Nocardioides sp. BP30]|uniref:hypothetical protein n=1 Tax=Nocardioides sp. BP30 TaxID=3036374 RepID=UPI0024696ECC|nr:hypothetical protein [Nocardioides sp. BP30]WGL51603.1 hypothetical protein P5P86_16770 [Nocardioides sp. BP30]
MSLWSHITGAVGTATNAVGGAVGEAENAARFVAPGNDDSKIDWNFNDSADKVGNQLSTGFEKVASTPGIKQAFWLTGKANEYLSTLEAYGDLNSNASLHDFFTGGNYSWSYAHRLQQQRNLNVGQGFALMFEDKRGEILNDHAGWRTHARSSITC